MANPRIEVEFIAKVDGLAAGVNSATGQLNQLGKSVDATSPKFDRLGDATRNYNAVGVNFARFIQDLPYGIIGVGNNITALAESFDQASNKGQSISQVLGGIFSAGNLVTLGVSALVTAWTFYSQNAEETIDLNEEVTKTFKELGDTVEDTADKLGTLKFVNDIIRAQEDEVRKLNKNFSIFSITAEEAVNITTDAFAKLNKTQLTGIKSTLSELANDQLKVVGNALDLTRKEAIKFVDGLKGNTAAFEALDPKVRDAVSAYNQLSSQVNTAGQQLEFYNEKQEKVDFRKEALDRYSKSWDDYNLAQETAANLTNKLTSSTKDYEEAIKNVLTRNESPGIVPQITGDNAWDQYTYSVYQFRDASIQANAEITETSTKALEFSERIKNLSGKEVKINLKVEGFDEKAGPTPFEIFVDSLQYALDKLPPIEERIAEFAFTTKDLLQNNVTDAFIDLGYSIGEALASGGNVIKAVGQSVLRSFGKFLGQFGEQLIAYGVSAIAFGKASLALSNPFTAIPAGGVAIAAGVALTAISGVIGSLGKKGPGGGGGGGGSSVGSSGVGGGSEFVGTGAQGGMFASQRDLNGELVVRGQDLVYVFGQANNRINKG